MYVPPISIFSGPRIVNTHQPGPYIRPLPYKDYESYQVEYPNAEPMPDREQHIVIQKPENYVSPFESYSKFQRSAEKPGDQGFAPREKKTRAVVEEPVPILHIQPPPPKVEVPFDACGLPKGYADQERQRQIEEMYNWELQQQLNYGYKSREKRPKEHIDQFYRNLKVSIDKNGYISIDNVPPQKPQKNRQGAADLPNSQPVKFSNLAYRKQERQGSNLNNEAYHRQHTQQAYPNIHQHHDQFASINNPLNYVAPPQAKEGPHKHVYDIRNQDNRVQQPQTQPYPGQMLNFNPQTQQQPNQQFPSHQLIPPPPQQQNGQGNQIQLANSFIDPINAESNESNVISHPIDESFLKNPRD